MAERWVTACCFGCNIYVSDFVSHRYIISNSLAFQGYSMIVKVRAAKVEDYKNIKVYDEFAGDRRFDMERGELLVADVDQNKAVGFLKITSNEFFNKPLISIVNTHPNYRNKGIATALIKKALEQASWYKVYTTIEASNVKTQKLFLSIGFDRVGEIKECNFNEETEVVFCYTKYQPLVQT